MSDEAFRKAIGELESIIWDARNMAAIASGLMEDIPYGDQAPLDHDAANKITFAVFAVEKYVKAIGEKWEEALHAKA
jgi:hypothetical protein